MREADLSERHEDGGTPVTLTADARRVDELHSYGVLTDPPRRDLTALTALAAHVCDVPWAAINLITVSEQVQVAAFGITPGICSRADSMCSAILHETAPVVVADARLDPRFHDNPFVTGELARVRFYAAAHLITPDGVAIGTLCVFDNEPREISQVQREALQLLADRVVDALELGLRSHQLERSLRVLRDTQAELRRSNEELAAFAGQAAHDLRNPLTSVSMSLQMLRETEVVTADEDTRWMVERALSGALRMDQMIEELLAYGQVGGNLRRERVDLAAVMDLVCADLDGALHGVDVLVGALPVVFGDPVQLRLVLQNLVANAAKFSRPSGAPEVRVGSERTELGWRVAVADNGRGVPAEDRERVFEPLVRFGQETKGSGLGLAICARVVRAHGGTIRMDASATGGALVWFDLPDEV